MSKNITISFDDNFNTSKINNNKKLILLLTTSKFTKTLEILLENKVNLNVLIEKKAQCARLDILAFYVAPNSI